MTFCEGKLAEFERMMKTIPGFDKRPLAEKEKEKDCEYCACYDKEKRTCGHDRRPFHR